MGQTIEQNDLESHMDLPLLPLKDIVVFPHMIIPVFINEELCIKAVEESLANNRKIFLSAFKIPGHEEDGLECKLAPPFDVYNVGTVCTIMRTRKLPDGRMKVLVQGIHKATVDHLVQSEEFPLVHVNCFVEPRISNTIPELEAMVRAVRENLEKVASLGKILSPDILMILEDVKDPGRLSDLVASNLGLKVEEAQKILSVFDPIDRLKKVHTYLSREIEVYQMQVRIQSQAKEEIGKMQREHFLREQIKALKSELGDADPKEELDEFWKKLEQLDIPEEGKMEVSRQIRRLERMHQDTSEATLTRNHIETVLALPWNNETEDELDLLKVGHILDKDHFGLEQIKDRIIEYLAVKKLNPAAKSPILCFVGPPGVGKTSLGRSIAKSIGREFARISLGGVRDEADIRGHRKTYVGAYPGRLIQSLKQVGVKNPIIMLDEIDKLGSDHRGDPSSALLEVLDPEQNHNFVDHFLGINFDLSKIMFIANANSLEQIPHPLRDRLEIINLSGYSEEEKLEITNKFLIPKQISDNGIGNYNIRFNNNAIRDIIRGYTRESGLRSLEKQIAAICRKIARSIAEKNHSSKEIKITKGYIEKLLGAKKFSGEFFHEKASPGVSLGMAYTQYGGEVLAIETNMLQGKGKLVLTGQLGDVMKESAWAALSYIRSKSNEFGVESVYLKDHELHVHVPQGAIPKDGPSAGVALVTSMLSALLGKAPKALTSMTGEITLHGIVLPVGGIKEKVLAAQREGIKEIILPEKNRIHFNTLPANVKKKCKFHFVSNYQQVWDILFESQKSPLYVPQDIESSQDLAS